MRQGGLLAWKLCREGLIVSRLLVWSVVELCCDGVGLGVYRERKEGEETINSRQKCNHYA
jgi:hypothetical protein